MILSLIYCFLDIVHFSILLRLSNFLINCSTKYFYLDDSEQKILEIKGSKSFGEFVKDENNLKNFIPRIFTPDVYVQNTIDDYKNGLDNQLETAKRILVEKELENDSQREEA